MNEQTENSKSISLVGCGVSAADLTEKHLAVIRQADVLAGGQRLLDWFPDFKKEKVSVDAHVASTIDVLVAKAKSQKVVLLASGDPLFFGIGRLLAEKVGSSSLKIYPNITALQSAMARLGMSWHTAQVFSVHGRKSILPWRRILQAQLAAIYTDPERDSAKVAAELIARYPASAKRNGFIVSDLGMPTEKVTSGVLSDLALAVPGKLSILVLHEGGEVPPVALGLDNGQYERHAEMITHPEIRAVAISKLRVKPGVMWDVGAGSGSVGIEAGLLCPGVAVYSVEQDEERCRHITVNAEQAGVSPLTVVRGQAPTSLKDLPDPDFVFVGGGGADISGIVEYSMSRLKSGGRVVVTAVLLETKACLLECCAGKRIEVLDLMISRASKLGGSSRMTPDNPVTIFVFEKELS